MKRHLNSYCYDAFGAGRRRLLIGVLGVGFGFCALACGSNVRAQQTEQTEQIVSADTALKVSRRAEKFMRDIAALSPMLQTADPIHRQAWPRSLETNLSARQREQALKPLVTAFISPNIPLDGPGWEVHLQGREEIDLFINAKGVVASFSNTQLTRTLYNEPPIELEEQFISSEAASARALKYMAAMGINTNDYALNRVQFFNNSTPASAASQIWHVYYDRVWQGVLYLQHRAGVDLDAAQGRLLHGGIQNFAVLPPLVGRLDVSAEQALGIARRFIVPRVDKFNGDADAELRVVLPSHFWTSNGRDDSPSTTQSRLAWYIRQPVIMGALGERVLEVWVDTLTGEILGGENIGRMGAGKIGPPGGRIGRTLRAAHYLQATPIAPSGQSADRHNSTKSLSLSANKLRFYSIVADITGPSMDTRKPLVSVRKFTPTHHLSAKLADGKTVTYLYDAVTGNIAAQEGAGSEIVQAGGCLRNWLLPIASTSPAAKNK